MPRVTPPVHPSHLPRVGQIYSFAKTPGSDRDGTLPSNLFWGARELEKLGHQVDHFYPRATFEKPRFGKFAGYFAFIRRHREALNRCDIVYTTSHHGLEAASFAVQLGLLRTRVVGLFGAINLGQDRGIIPSLHHTFDRLVFRGCRKVLYFTSGEAIQARENTGYDSERIDWIPLGVDRTFYPESTKTRSEVILTIGNDGNRDWHAFRRLAESMPQRQFKLLTQNRSVANLSFPMNVDVRFGGSFAEAQQALATAACLLLMTKENRHFSGLTTVLNSLMVGTPLVLDEAYACDDYDLRHGINCLRFRRGDVHSAAEQLLRLRTEDGFAASLRAQARLLAPRFTMEKMGQALSRHFCTLTDVMKKPNESHASPSLNLSSS